MELSIYILQEELQKQGFAIEKEADAEIFIDGTAYFNVNYLALPENPEQKIICVDAENMELFLANITRFQKRCVICLPECREALLKQPELHSLMVWEKGGDRSRAEEMVAGVFRSYYSWREKIMLQIIEQKDIQMIVDTLSLKVDNPFSLLDNNSFILGRTKNYENLPAGTIWDYMHGSYLSIFDFYTHKEWNEISHQLQRSPETPVLVHPDKDKRHTYYIASLNINGKTNASIGSMDILAPFTKGQIAVMDQVKELLLIYLRTRYRASKSHIYIHQTFNSIMNGKNVPEQEVSKMLDKRHWLMDGSYYLMAFRYPVILNSEPELASYINIIRMQFPKALAAVANQAILLVQRIEDFPLNDKKTQDKTRLFLEKSGLYCGYSFPFYHFGECFHHLDMVLYAAGYAERKRKRLVNYADIQSQHVLYQLSGHTEVSYLAHPQIVKLANSTKKSDRALVDCLYEYLLNGCSISATVRSMGLHRNTIIYRIQKLEELFSIQFDSAPAELRFSFLLSCLIVRTESDEELRAKAGVLTKDL
ncbi:MAG: helix-turn-helix domain-containing protein [Lachnospiraceae bacterium]|nr:helix-turn-helix domain-containing protein [Lachnospiraceae bacterium]